MSRIQDTLGVLKGLQVVAEASFKLQEENLRQIWSNSSLRTLTVQVADQLKNESPSANPQNASPSLADTFSEGVNRLSSVVTGIKEFTSVAGSNFAPQMPPKESTSSTITNSVTSSRAKEAAPKAKPNSPPVYQIKLTQQDKELLKKLELEHLKRMDKPEEKITKQISQIDVNKVMSDKDKKKENKKKSGGTGGFGREDVVVDVLVDPGVSRPPKSTPKVQVVPNPKSKLKLSAAAKQRAVPSSRISRMVSFGTLAAGLGIGTVAEYTRRVVGIGEPSTSPNTFLSQGNMDRIVDTLCKVRGAALKLGQIMSIQDESFISPELARALERVRKSADFMPTWQVEKVMISELGPDWRSKLSDFDEKPFAAASIGQVHWGKTAEDQQEVALKIQYPGVAKGIESDIENLMSIMKVWNVFPKGMFVDNLATVAKRELAWEVDYIREAECTKKFKELLQPYPDFFVPKVIDSLSSAQVFTTQLVDGIPVDQCVDLEQDERNFIGEKILELCLLELMEFQYMQTDPNWANFLYNRLTKQIVLLDFGASRAYSKPFMDNYIKIIKAAADGDKETVLKSSRDIGFLTGYESKMMEDAHVEAVMILGEIFRCPGRFDFGVQNTTARMQDLVPTMIANRLCPPPEEIYSIHRKISGIFLLCLKLKAHIRSQDIFNSIFSRYRFDD